MTEGNILRHWYYSTGKVRSLSTRNVFPDDCNLAADSVCREIVLGSKY